MKSASIFVSLVLSAVLAVAPSPLAHAQSPFGIQLSERPAQRDALWGEREVLFEDIQARVLICRVLGRDSQGEVIAAKIIVVNSGKDGAKVRFQIDHRPKDSVKWYSKMVNQFFSGGSEEVVLDLNSKFANILGYPTVKNASVERR